MNRIQQLPRRNWRARADEARQLNALLRAPGGSQQLHDIQAVTLLEAWESGTGVNCYARVGAGKSHVIGLLPTLMARHPHSFSRPLIVVPGSLREKTEAEFAQSRQHWRIANQYWLESYTALAQESKADILEERQPDMLLFDEPDGLRRVNATSRRIGRYVQARREAWACPTHRQPQKEGDRCTTCGGALVKGLPTFCGFFHATPYRDAITDFSHMVNWALGERSPFPLDPLEVQQWSLWLDQEDPSGRPAFAKYFSAVTDGGALGDGGVEASEDAFRERITSTPGIILSDDSFTDAELTVDVHIVDPGLDREFQMLRELWQRPDGWDLAQVQGDDDPDEVNSWSIWGVARQLALGFFYQADPTPPKAWMAARKAWVSYVRAIIDAPGSRYDTEKQVRSACERAAERGGRKVPEWAAWIETKDSFRPGRRPVWISTHAIDAAKAWGAQGPGVIWTDLTAFGERLSQETGWTYYGQRGLDAAGRSIEQASGDRTIIASTRANQRGRNLQYAFWRNLNVSVQNAAADVEQWLGRTHRFGQTNGKVHADIYCACSEHWKALDTKLPKGAHKAERLLALTQKLNSVSMNIHGAASNPDKPSGWAWR